MPSVRSLKFVRDVYRGFWSLSGCLLPQKNCKSLDKGEEDGKKVSGSKVRHKELGMAALL